MIFFFFKDITAKTIREYVFCHLIKSDNEETSRGYGVWSLWTNHKQITPPIEIYGGPWTIGLKS